MEAHRFTLVDDDSDTLCLLHRMIARLYPESSIAMFSDAEDALTHILETGTDILITNHGTGKISGMDLIRQLRVRNLDLPIIMMSANSGAEEEAMAAGATKFVDKRVAHRVFEAHIRALVEVGDARTKTPHGGGEPAGGHKAHAARKATA